jgi:two-component system chemotaxis sensor kinase CheA
MSAGRDRYKYYRIEAREVLDALCNGALQLEKGSPPKDLVASMLRLAHTLKGASLIVKANEIAKHAHAMEGILAPYRSAPDSPPREQIDQLLRLVDDIRTGIVALDRVEAQAPEAAPTAAREAPFETVRVELEEMDLLLDSVGEAAVQLHALRRDTAEIPRALQLATVLAEQVGGAAADGRPGSARALAVELREALRRIAQNVAAGAEQLDAELTQVQDAANGLRLLPASSIFALLERATRDAASSVGRMVDFRVSGGSTRLDAHVLAALRDALLHVVRNAVAHGIEPSSERTACGKPAAGRVEIVVERRGTKIAFACRDDGRGIDVAALGQAAVREGLVASQSGSLARGEAFRLLLEGGLTTTQTVTEVSGRGVGLDVVRAVAARLKGDVSVRSEPGQGTTFEIVVPVTLTSVPALVVEVGDVVASVPVDAVAGTLRVADAEIASAPGRNSMVYDGKVIPFVPLSKVVSRAAVSTRAASRHGRTWSAVVVQAGNVRAAVGVDRLRGIVNTVMRSLPSWAEADAAVAGASLDAEGNAQLVLDPAGLVAAAHAAEGPVAEAPLRTAPILVVDDSLTTRMLEQSILEAAGYEVDLATSAEEALIKARDRRYGLFLVDVEMPGMDGFQFVSFTRADPVLRATPAILVTSRASAEDRRRGQDAGAHAYVVKGDFDQASLLRTIGELVG